MNQFAAMYGERFTEVTARTRLTHRVSDTSATRSIPSGCHAPSSHSHSLCHGLRPISPVWRKHVATLMRKIGLPVATANARSEVKEAAVYVTSCSGGRGAVREVAELILKSQGKWKDVLKFYGV